MNKRKFSIDWNKVTQQINDQNNKTNFKDERIFSPQYREDDTFQAIIRFLMSKDTDIPFVSLYNHSFNGPGGWYIENCPTTIKKKCPVCEANSLIWDNNPDLVRIRKRKLSYYSNILIIKDPQTPENNGKVFLYRYGKKIYEKIMEKWQPPEGSIIQPVPIFDYYDGANFNLISKKIKIKKEKVPNYDSSNFDVCSCLGTDEEIEKIHNQLFGLKDFQNESNFKSYDELKAKFLRVSGQSIATEETGNSVERVVSEKEQTNDQSAPTIFSDDDNDEFFKNLDMN